MELQKLVNDLGLEASAFFQKGNQTAGIRFRKGMSKLRVLALDLRKIAAEKRTAKR